MKPCLDLILLNWMIAIHYDFGGNGLSKVFRQMERAKIVKINRTKRYVTGANAEQGYS